MVAKNILVYFDGDYVERFNCILRERFYLACGQWRSQLKTLGDVKYSPLSKQQYSIWSGTPPLEEQNDKIC